MQAPDESSRRLAEYETLLEFGVDALRQCMLFARVDDAARRVLSAKCQQGLFGWRRDPALVKCRSRSLESLTLSP